MSDTPTSDDPTSADATSNNPPEGAVPSPPVTDEPRDGSRIGWGAVIAVLVLALVAGAGFFVGRTTADSGPDSVAAAIKENAHGDLAAGDLSFQQILSLLPKASGNGGSASGNLGGLLGSRDFQQLLEELGRELGSLPGGNGSGGGSGSTTTPRAFLGISAEPAPNGQSGVRVALVADASPAADAGLRVGDVITAVDGQGVASPAALVAAVRSHQPGDAITLTYTRDGQSASAKVRLGNTDTAATPSTTAPPTTRVT